MTSLANCLEAIRLRSPHTRLFYAGSCHVFGSPRSEPQGEDTPFEPESVYGITKAAGVQICRLYRKTHGVFAGSGILYNHEFSFRGPGFLSTRIVEGVVGTLRRSGSKFTIGDLDASAGWGYAGEYVDAMRRILRANDPDDFVIATGVANTVRDFVAHAFAHFDLDWRDHVEEKPALLKRRTSGLIGNRAKLQRVTGWQARIRLPELIKTLIEAKLNPPVEAAGPRSAGAQPV